MATIAADVAVNRGGNQIAALKPAHLRTQLLDSPRYFMAGDDGHFNAAPERSVAHHDIVETNPAGRNPDPDLARPGLARRHLGNTQDARRPGCFDDDRAHGVTPVSSPRANRR